MDSHNQKNGSRKLKKDKSKRRRLMIHHAISRKVTNTRNRSLRVRRDTKRRVVSNPSISHYKEMQGILDLMCKFPQDDNYQSTQINAWRH